MHTSSIVFEIHHLSNQRTWTSHKRVHFFLITTKVMVSLHFGFIKQEQSAAFDVFLTFLILSELFDRHKNWLFKNVFYSIAPFSYPIYHLFFILQWSSIFRWLHKQKSTSLLSPRIFETKRFSENQKKGITPWIFAAHLVNTLYTGYTESVF